MKAIRMEMKRDKFEICAFNAEKRNNGNIKGMCVALECLPKGSDEYKDLVRCITKEIVPSNSDEEE